MFKSWEDKLEQIGKHLGYPSCCIEAFKDIKPWSLREDEVKQVTQGGFVPCVSCARKILRGEVTIRGLITNRKNSGVFPEENKLEIDALYNDPIIEVE